MLEDFVGLATVGPSLVGHCYDSSIFRMNQKTAPSIIGGRKQVQIYGEVQPKLDCDCLCPTDVV